MGVGFSPGITSSSVQQEVLAAYPIRTNSYLDMIQLPIHGERLFGIGTKEGACIETRALVCWVGEYAEVVNCSACAECRTYENVPPALEILSQFLLPLRLSHLLPPLPPFRLLASLLLSLPLETLLAPPPSEPSLIVHPLLHLAAGAGVAAPGWHRRASSSRWLAVSWWTIPTRKHGQSCPLYCTIRAAWPDTRHHPTHPTSILIVSALALRAERAYQSARLSWAEQRGRDGERPSCE
jgi:hypothetical protein